MGNSQSSPNKNHTRRSNRLSKPLTKKLSLRSRSEDDSPVLTSGLIGWQNPWVGSTISEVKSHLKPSEIPPTLFESALALPVQGARENPPPRDNQSLEPLPPRSISFSARAFVRRASQPVLDSSALLSRAPEQPKRANSVQTPLQRHRSAIYESTIEDATSSNTHFLVGNQRFSLTRRRSLLTRPGVATRRTTGAIRRMPSPIGEPELDDSEPSLLPWPIPPRQRPSLVVAAPARPTSPTDTRYTQLGALKLGSLRVVNGSASPCPSERIPLSQSTVPGLGLENVATICSQATLEIPSVADMKKVDDAPGSPFSFERSPTITVQPRAKAMFSRDLEDEGIAMYDDSQLEKNTTDPGLDRSTSRSLNKSDSGYSSATSLRSVHRSRTRASFDSQVSGSLLSESSRSSWIPVTTGPDDSVQRHTVLRETKLESYSARWYDSSGPTAQQTSGSRVRRSTLCAPRYTEYSTQEGLVVGSSNSPYLFTDPQQRALTSRGSFYADSVSVSTLDASSSRSGSSTTLEAPRNHLQSASTYTKDRIRRSASEYDINDKEKQSSVVHLSRFRSRTGSRVWCQRPGIEVPALPTILSPDYMQAGEEDDWGFPEVESRGRPRSRSLEYRRRRLTKAQPPPNVQTTTSSFEF